MGNVDGQETNLKILLGGLVRLEAESAKVVGQLTVLGENMHRLSTDLAVFRAGAVTHEDLDKIESRLKAESQELADAAEAVAVRVAELESQASRLRGVIYAVGTIVPIVWSVLTYVLSKIL